MIDILIVAAMPPKAQNSRKACVVNGHARIYVPSAVKQWRADFAAAAAPLAPASPIEGAVRVDVFAVLPRPKALCRSKDPEGLIWAPRRPDGDNIRKAILDALSSWWRDDAQVVAGETIKIYSEKTGVSRTVAWVRSLERISVGDALAQLGIDAPVLQPMRNGQSGLGAAERWVDAEQLRMRLEREANR